MSVIDAMLAFNKTYQEQNKDYNPIIYIVKNLHKINNIQTWNMLLSIASLNNDMKTIEMAISLGANNWDMGMYGASAGGHLNIVEFFIQKGANNWDLGKSGAYGGRHINIAEFFIKKMQS